MGSSCVLPQPASEQLPGVLPLGLQSSPPSPEWRKSELTESFSCQPAVYQLPGQDYWITNPAQGGARGSRFSCCLILCIPLCVCRRTEGPETPPYHQPWHSPGEDFTKNREIPPILQVRRNKMSPFTRHPGEESPKTGEWLSVMGIRPRSDHRLH